jgi:two-component system cell cycle sensor histidine kinase/response regulator CckA
MSQQRATERTILRAATPTSLSLTARLAAGSAVAFSVPAALLGAGDLALAALGATGAAALTCYSLGFVAFEARKRNCAASSWAGFEALPEGFALGDETGRIFRCNGMFRQLLDLDRAPKHVSVLSGHDKELAASAYRLLACLKSEVQASALIKDRPAPNRAARTLRLSVTASPQTPAPRGAKGRMLIWHVSPAPEPVAAAAAERPQGLAVQLLLDALPLAALLFDARGQIIASNGMLKSLAGADKGERMSGPVTELLLRENGEPFKGLQWRHFVSRARDGVVRLKRGAIPGERMRAFFSENRKDAGVHQGWTLCVLAPEASHAARTDDAGWTDLLSGAPIAVALIHADGGFLSANAAFSRMFAWPSDGNAGGIADLVDPSSRAALIETLKRVSSLEGQSLAEPANLEVKFGLEGRRRAQLFISPSAKAKQLILYGIDTTAQHTLEEQVAHSQKMQAMGQLAGGIAHDFNNVLTAIIGFSDLLLARFRPSDAAFKDIMNIKQNANRAADLVRHLLAYSRRQTLRPRVLSLTDVIEDFNSSLGRLLGEKVKARIVHGRDLWLVKADESQLFQVIMNLSVNARDAMPGGGLLTIRTANVTERESIALGERGIERGEYVLWEVSDTGTGIPAEHLGKIFDPFFSTKEVGKGTGLGLSLVDGIIRQTGGSILVDSQLGQGTTFRIYLPRYQMADEELRAAAAARKPVDAAPADLTGSATVLLVEDEDAVRSFASRALTTRGYHVLEAASGAEALEVMDREKGAIDLVVSDVVMPEMDGPTLLGHLRKRKPGIRIVFMSGYAEEAFRKNLSEDEKFIFLPKPFTLKKLAETIKEATAA